MEHRRGVPRGRHERRGVDLDLALLQVPVGPHRAVARDRAVGLVHVERRGQVEQPPELADPGADRDDDLVDGDLARARRDRRHGPAPVELEARDLDAFGDARARVARQAGEPVHRLLVEREPPAMLVQADLEPGRPPVGVERFACGRRPLAGRRPAPSCSRCAPGARRPPRGPLPGPRGRARCTRSRGSAASRARTPRSPRRRPSAPASRAGSSCCARPRTRCPTRRPPPRSCRRRARPHRVARGATRWRGRGRRRR